MDARGKLGFMSIHKTTSALRQLAYGCSVNLFDEHLEMSARTSRESLINFCKVLIACTGHGSCVQPHGAVRTPDGMLGSNNDINVFEASPVLEKIISGLAPTEGFYANNNYYKARYYLTDDIYPEYSTFVKTFTDPIDDKRKYFKKKQEST
uniref:uncharacterized protein LOC122610701 n=1 Tax=Erigeron canadensis TaxID=72917 RepID=UPI001CB961E8|nr:uncharacterized protein LOC122610701 [Erigeron canadensis]